MHICRLVYKHFVCLFQLRGPRSNNLELSPWFFIPFNGKKKEEEQESQKKWLIKELGQEIYKMSREYLIVIENEEMLKQKKPTRIH